MKTANLTKNFKLQYASNLFVTSHEKPLFPLFLQPSAPNLALVGNVGNPRSPFFSSFFDWASSRWDSIIYVPGPEEQSETYNPCEILKFHQNVFVLNKQNPFYIHEPLKLALWTPTESSLYSKLYVFTYDQEHNRTFLEHHGTIYSHGINGINKKIHINSRGNQEHPEIGFDTQATMNFPVKKYH